MHACAALLFYAVAQILLQFTLQTQRKCAALCALALKHEFIRQHVGCMSLDIYLFLLLAKIQPKIQPIDFAALVPCLSLVNQAYKLSV